MLEKIAPVDFRRLIAGACLINFAVKVYPQVIWGETYQGNFAALVDHIAGAGINNIVVPAFQGSRIFFSQPMETSPNPWSLSPLKKECKERGLGFAIELPLFHDRDAFDKIADLRPRSPAGEQYPGSGWYWPVCPSNESYAQWRLHLIQEALTDLEPALVMLNFLWYPYWPAGWDWEPLGTKVSSFCFCPACRARFTETTGMLNAAEDVEAWFAFRATTLANFLAEINEFGQGLKVPPSLILEVPPAPTPHVVERLRRLAGIDLIAWRNLVRVISPQLFHNECGRLLAWAAEVIQELQALDYSLFPQVDLPSASSYKQEMRTNLHAFLRSLDSSAGGAVMLCSWDTLHTLPDVRDLIADFNL